MLFRSGQPRNRLQGIAMQMPTQGINDFGQSHCHIGYFELLMVRITLSVMSFLGLT